MSLRDGREVTNGKQQWGRRRRGGGEEVEEKCKRTGRCDRFSFLGCCAPFACPDHLGQMLDFGSTALGVGQLSPAQSLQPMKMLRPSQPTDDDFGLLAVASICRPPQAGGEDDAISVFEASSQRLVARLAFHDAFASPCRSLHAQHTRAQDLDSSPPRAVESPNSPWSFWILVRLSPPTHLPIRPSSISTIVR